jgi:acetylornithine deacetylase
LKIPKQLRVFFGATGQSGGMRSLWQAKKQAARRFPSTSPWTRLRAMSTTAETLARLAAFPTISADSNEALITYAATRITAAGGRIHTMAGALPGKFNLLASFGPDTAAGLVFSGHSDVVPVQGQDWKTDPFTLTQKDDRLYARGASDMKAFLAAMLTAAERMDSKRLSRPLHLAFSYDEEIGCVGVRNLLARLQAEAFQAQGCIIGEPTEMRVMTGHKGKLAGCICCRGIPAHSANPTLGCNAIQLAAAMVRQAESLQSWLAANGARDAAYPLPYTSVHIGTIAGGTALNIVPEYCRMDFEIRSLAADDPAALVERLRESAARIVAEAGKGEIEIEVTNTYPGLNTPADAPLAQAAVHAAGTEIGKIGFGTEAGLFEEMLGLPCIICGPGSIDRAHKPDEYVTIGELEACDAFLDRMIETLR